MAFSCAICSGSLEKGAESNPAATDVSTTTCGHIFHTSCIHQWLAREDRKTCPCCRKKIIVDQVIQLFPTLHEVTLSQEPASDVTAAGPVLIPCDHITEINKLKEDLRRLNANHEEFEKMYKLQSGQLHDARAKCQYYQIAYNNLYTSYKNLHEKDQKELKMLTEQLKKYEYIENTLKGVEHESEEDLKIFAEDKNAIQTLIGVKNLLEKKLKLELKLKEGIIRENEKIVNQLLDSQGNRPSLEAVPSTNKNFQYCRNPAGLLTGNPAPAPVSPKVHVEEVAKDSKK